MWVTGTPAPPCRVKNRRGNALRIQPDATDRGFTGGPGTAVNAAPPPLAELGFTRRGAKGRARVQRVRCQPWPSSGPRGAAPPWGPTRVHEARCQGRSRVQWCVRPTVHNSSSWPHTAVPLGRARTLLVTPAPRSKRATGTWVAPGCARCARCARCACCAPLGVHVHIDDQHQSAWAGLFVRIVIECEPSMQFNRNLLKWAVTTIAVSLGVLVVAATLMYVYIQDARHKGYCA